MLTFSVAPVVRRRPTNWNHGRNARPAPKHPRSNNSFQRTGLRPAADAGLRRHATMAIDGPGIVESDLGHDVYNEILDLYDAGPRTNGDSGAPFVVRDRTDRRIGE